jgi:hypothetical protein
MKNKESRKVGIKKPERNALSPALVFSCFPAFLIKILKHE